MLSTFRLMISTFRHTNCSISMTDRLGAASSQHTANEMDEYVERVLNYAAAPDAGTEIQISAEDEAHHLEGEGTSTEEQDGPVQPGFSKSSHVFLDIAQPDAPEVCFVRHVAPLVPHHFDADIMSSAGHRHPRQACVPALRRHRAEVSLLETL